MKKVLLSTVAIAALALASCGKSACDCATEGKALYEKMLKSSGDDYDKLDKEYKALEEECKDYKDEDYKDCE